MSMNRRELTLAIIVAVTIGGWALLSWVIDPAIAAFSEVQQESEQLEKDLSAAKNIVDNEATILRRWAGYEKAGLARSLEDADAQTSGTILTWAEDAGFKQVNLSDGKAKTDDEQPFGQISYTLQTAGTLSQIYDLLWSIQESPFPLSMEKCVIDLQNDKDQRLQLSLTVSTLFTPAEETR